MPVLHPPGAGVFTRAGWSFRWVMAEQAGLHAGIFRHALLSRRQPGCPHTFCLCPVCGGRWAAGLALAPAGLAASAGGAMGDAGHLAGLDLSADTAGEYLVEPGRDGRLSG